MHSSRQRRKCHSRNDRRLPKGVDVHRIIRTLQRRLWIRSGGDTRTVGADAILSNVKTEIKADSDIAVKIDRAKLAGDLIISKGIYSSGSSSAIEATTIKVAGSTALTSLMMSSRGNEPTLTLRGAQVTGQVQFHDFTVHNREGVGIDAQGLRGAEAFRIVGSWLQLLGALADQLDDVTTALAREHWQHAKLFAALQRASTALDAAHPGGLGRVMH